MGVNVESVRKIRSLKKQGDANSVAKKFLKTGKMNTKRNPYKCSRLGNDANEDGIIQFPTVEAKFLDARIQDTRYCSNSMYQWKIEEMEENMSKKVLKGAKNR